MVELQLLLVGQHDATVQPRLHRPRPGVRPATPEVDAKQKTNDKLPHCLSNSEHLYVETLVSNLGCDILTDQHN